MEIKAYQLIADPCYEVFQRRMSKGELEELRSTIRRMKKPSRFFILFSMGMTISLTVIFLTVWEGQFHQWLKEYGFQFAVMSTFFIYVCYAYIRVLLMARLMKFDLSQGTLMIIKLKKEHEDMIEDGYSYISEILPVSLAVWSEEGIPGHWRFSKARPRTRQGR